MECSICYERGNLTAACLAFEQDSWTKRDVCNHTFCSTCLARHVTTQLEDGLRTITCPSAECRCTMTSSDVQRHTGIKGVARYQAILQAQHPDRADDLADADVKPCPACNVMISRDDGGCNTVWCKCGHTFKWNPDAPEQWEQGQQDLSDVPFDFIVKEMIRRGLLRVEFEFPEI